MTKMVGVLDPAAETSAALVACLLSVICHKLRWQISQFVIPTGGRNLLFAGSVGGAGDNRFLTAKRRSE
jgi:hypothetical protein